MDQPRKEISDLYIPVGTGQRAHKSQRSTQATSLDDSVSIKTDASTVSTAPTSNPAEETKSSEQPRRTHRYTITARTDAPAGVIPLDRSSITAKQTTPSRLSGSHVSSSKSRTHNQATQPNSNNRVASPNGQTSSGEHVTSTGSGSDSFQSLSDPRLDHSSKRVESPSQPNISKSRYPPSSYRGGALEEAARQTTRSACSIPPPLKKDSKDGLVFGKLTLDQMSRAIDAPPSPHKPSGISRLVRRMSGRRSSTPPTPTKTTSKLLPPTPTKPLPPTPTTAVPTVPTVPRTDSSSSIPSAPAPYTSPDPSSSPKKILKSRRRTLTNSKKTPTDTCINNDSTQTSLQSRSASATNTATSTTLPAPETVYAETEYFTACPHTSPPSHRPLNVQPLTTQFTPTLLKYTPLHLRARLNASKSLPVITVLAGSCPDCDYAARRQQEGEVLAKYADTRNRLLSRIRALRTRINAAAAPAVNPRTSRGTDTMTHGSSSEKVQSGDSSDEDSDPHDHHQSQTPNDALAEEEQQDLELDMLGLESEIEDLPEQQDRDVHRVWSGWAAKWGPGTVGIHRVPLEEDPTLEIFGRSVDRDRSEDDGVEVGLVRESAQREGLSRSTNVGTRSLSLSPSPSGAASESRSGTVSEAASGNEGRSRSTTDSTRDTRSQSSTSASASASVSQSGRSTRLNKWAGLGSRFEDQVVSEGRMKLDWIRPDWPKDGRRKEKKKCELLML